MTEAGIRVQLVHAWPQGYWQLPLDLPDSATAADALAAAAQALSEAGIELESLELAVFGRAVGLATRLRDGDRLELLRPLQLSPQQARAMRAAAAARRAAKERAGPGRTGKPVRKPA